MSIDCVLPGVGILALRLIHKYFPFYVFPLCTPAPICGADVSVALGFWPAVPQCCYVCVDTSVYCPVFANDGIAVCVPHSDAPGAR